MALADRPGLTRLDGLDGLRCLLALGVAWYHVAGWSTGSSPLLRIVGIHAVEGFFILSGFCIHWVYAGTDFRRQQQGLHYLTQRLLRIIPLYGMVAVLTHLQHPTHDPLYVMTSVVWMIADPSVATVTGGWSIGVELACYILYGMLRWSSGSRHLGIMTLCMLGVSLGWTYGMLDPSRPLADQWSMYIQMPHHVGWWFLGAFLAQHYHRIMQLPLHYFCTGFAMVAGYGWYLAPLDLATDQIATTTGAFRVCMLLFMPLLVLGFARAGSGVPHVGPVLRHLGNATYGLYLLHPLVYWSLNWQRLLPAHDLLVPVILGVTFIAAWASYTAIERPALRCNPFRIRP